MTQSSTTQAILRLRVLNSRLAVFPSPSGRDPIDQYRVDLDRYLHPATDQVTFTTDELAQWIERAESLVKEYIGTVR